MNIEISPPSHRHLAPRRGKRVRIATHVHYIVMLVSFFALDTLALWERGRRRAAGNFRVAAGKF